MDILGPGSYRGYIAGGGLSETKSGLPQAVFDFVATEERIGAEWKEIEGTFRGYCVLVKRDGNLNFWAEQLEEAGLWEGASFGEFNEREWSEDEVFEFGVKAGTPTADYPDPRDQVGWICREGEGRGLTALDAAAVKGLDSKFATLLKGKKTTKKKAVGKKKVSKKKVTKKAEPWGVEKVVTAVTLRCEADEETIRDTVAGYVAEYEIATDEDWAELVNLTLEALGVEVAA